MPPGLSLLGRMALASHLPCSPLRGSGVASLGRGWSSRGGPSILARAAPRLERRRPPGFPSSSGGGHRARSGAQAGKGRRREEDVATRAVLGHLGLILSESSSSAPGAAPAWLASPPIRLPEAGPWEMASRPPPPLPAPRLPAAPRPTVRPPAWAAQSGAAKGCARTLQLVHWSPQEVGSGGSGAGRGASEGGKPTCLVRAQPPAQVRAWARWP